MRIINSIKKFNQSYKIKKSSSKPDITTVNMNGGFMNQVVTELTSFQYILSITQLLKKQMERDILYILMKMENVIKLPNQKKLFN